MPFPKYFIGKGDIKVALLDADGNPGAFRDVGEATVEEFEPSVDFADNFATGKTSANLQDLHVPLKKQLMISITMKERTAKNLEMAVLGESSSEAAGSFSTPTALPDDLEVGNIVLLPGRHVGISNLVVVDSAGTPNVLVDGEHFSLNADAGMIELLNVNDADAVKATATITLVSQPNADDTLVVSGKTYTFKATPTTALHIGIGTDKETTATNIANRVNTDTATTLCTAVPHVSSVTLTANTGGTAGNSITLTVDGTRLTKVAFANGEAADALTQPFIVNSYDYEDSEVTTLMATDPPPMCVLFDGANLAVAGERVRSIVDRAVFGPAAKFSQKTGSASGTATEPDTYELKGVALILPGHTDYGEYRTY